MFRMHALRRLLAAGNRLWPRSETMQRLAAITGAAGDAIVGTSSGWIITDWNPAAERIYGYHAAEIIGRPVAMLIPTALEKDFDALKLRVLAGDPVHDCKMVTVARNGDLIPVSVAMSGIRRRMTVLAGVVISLRDLRAERRAAATVASMGDRLDAKRGQLVAAEATARAAEVEIRELGENLADAMDSITDGFYTTDSTGRFTYVNRAAERLMGHNRADLLGRSLWDVFPGAIAALRQQFDQAVETMRPTQRVAHATNGAWYDVRVYPSSQGLTVYFQDVSEHQRMTTALRSFARRVEAVQEAERSAIAREVHDEIGQSLTALRMDASRLRGMCVDDPDAQTLIVEMISMIDTTLQSARTVAMALHPTALDDLGLPAAIEIHVGHVARRANLKAVLDLDQAAAAIPHAQAAAAYRVLQESLTNVVRHANASEIRVRLSLESDAVVLEVSDDGRGIDPVGNDAAQSLGLLSMHERAAALDGTVVIAPAVPRGTTVTLRLPVGGDLKAAKAIP